MTNSRLHIPANILAILTFLLIAAGALLTSGIRPLPGTSPTAEAVTPMKGAAQIEEAHRILAALVGVLAVGLAIVSSPEIRLPAWITVGLVVVDALLGLQGGPGGMLAPVGGVFHAILAPLVFAGVASLVLFTSKNWLDPAVPARDVWPPLNRLAIVVPAFLILQIALGAAFRHNTVGVFWHILNAMVTLLLILMFGICVVRQYPEHPTLQPAAVQLLVVTGVQVLLGFAAFLVLLIVSQTNMALIVISVIHVLTGALTLAASIVLSLQFKRSGAVAASQTGH
jgi:heme A synthase